MALLAAHQQGNSPQMQPPPQAQPDPVDRLRKVIADIHAWLQVEPDEQDKVVGMKVNALLQGLIAKDQQDKDTLMGGNTSVVRALRKNA
jgi:hypothetical protein